jgi:hypothetical protein
MKKLLLAAIIAVSASLLPISVAASAVATGISGYEIFPGFTCAPGVTCGATFVGWTNSGVTTTWNSARNGGTWAVSINYFRPTSTTASVIGGNWRLSLPDGSHYSGAVTTGLVNWAAPGGCGGDVHAATATVGLTVNGGGTGSVMGCLNDRTTFPPKIWGNVALANVTPPSESD